MTPNTYKPDWLLQTPPRDKYLIKKEYMYKPNYLDKTMNNIYLLAYGNKNEDINNIFRTYNKLMIDNEDKNIFKQLK